MTHRLENGEYHVEWTCPGCSYFQHDSVHIYDGPWISCTCEKCGEAFDDDDLDRESLLSWEKARIAAEDAAEKHLHDPSEPIPSDTPSLPDPWWNTK